MMYLRWYHYDGGSDTPHTSTAAFWVAVDDYSQLIIPSSKSINCYGLLFLRHNHDISPQRTEQPHLPSN